MGRARAAASSALATSCSARYGRRYLLLLIQNPGLCLGPVPQPRLRSPAPRPSPTTALHEPHCRATSAASLQRQRTRAACSRRVPPKRSGHLHLRKALDPCPRPAPRSLQMPPACTFCPERTAREPNATENMERAHQNEHSKRANATQVKDTLNTMPGGELK